MKIIALMAFGLMMAFGVPIAEAAQTPRAAVEGLNQGIRADDPKKLRRAIEQNFDLHRVAISSVGIRRWREWTQEEQDTYRKVFIDYVLALYLNRFHDYDGSGLNIYKVEQKKKRARVRARIKPEVDKRTLASSDPVKIDFVLQKHKKHGWLIVDVYFKGTISEVAGFRAQFAQMAKDEGWAGLIREMKVRKKTLAQKK